MNRLTCIYGDRNCSELEYSCSLEKKKLPEVDRVLIVNLNITFKELITGIVQPFLKIDRNIEKHAQNINIPVIAFKAWEGGHKTWEGQKRWGKFKISTFCWNDTYSDKASQCLGNLSKRVSSKFLGVTNQWNVTFLLYTKAVLSSTTTTKAWKVYFHWFKCLQQFQEDSLLWFYLKLVRWNRNTGDKFSSFIIGNNQESYGWHLVLLS